MVMQSARHQQKRVFAPREFARALATSKWVVVPPDLWKTRIRSVEGVVMSLAKLRIVPKQSRRRLKPPLEKWLSRLQTSLSTARYRYIESEETFSFAHSHILLSCLE